MTITSTLNPRKKNSVIWSNVCVKISDRERTYILKSLVVSSLVTCRHSNICRSRLNCNVLEKTLDTIWNQNRKFQSDHYFKFFLLYNSERFSYVIYVFNLSTICSYSSIQPLELYFPFVVKGFRIYTLYCSLGSSNQLCPISAQVWYIFSFRKPLT